ATEMNESRVSLTVESASLQVQSAGEPPDDVPKVQETMLGPKVLDVAHHPAIRFQSTAISAKEAGGGAVGLQKAGSPARQGAVRPVSVPLRVELAGTQLRAHGSTTIRQSAFGIEPVTAAAGGVRVKDDVELRFSVVAHLTP